MSKLNQNDILKNLKRGRLNQSTAFSRLTANIENIQKNRFTIDRFRFKIRSELKT